MAVLPRLKNVIAFCLPVSALFLPLFATVASAQIAFEKGAGQMQISVDGKDFATYVWEDEKTSRPYFKQVKARGGEIQVTRNHPPQPGDLADHDTYHPGIWWGFGDIGGNDYWRMKAKVIGGEFVEGPKGGDDRGSFAVRNKMLTNEGDETFCEQVCRFTILKRPQGILMVCESIFVRDEDDFWLGDQEEMGLGIRVATSAATKSQKGGEIRDSEGRTVHEEIRTNQSDYCDYSGPIDGKHGGILLMNDPKNFRKPWWHAVDTGLLIANPLGESELSGQGKKRENVLVKKGEPFRLRYGALIHLHDNKNDFDPKKAYQDYLEILPGIASGFSSAAIPPSALPQVPGGFEVSIFAREPMVYKPTSVCFDAKGRLVVGQGPQYPKNFEDSPTDSVVLMIDSDNDGVADESKTFATGFNSIQGLAWKGSDLYVANAPELTIVRDLDGDDEADEYVMVYTDLGNREHALHGLNFAPDGKLYMSKGNSKGHNQPDKHGYVAPRPFRELWDVNHPPGAPDAYPPKKFSKDSYKKTYHHWDDDWGREGGVLRCDPSGENLELVSRGMRNPWDITIDPGFNFLGTDNDQDQGDRIFMPFFGAHFGWGHTYSSHWTGDNHLPTAPISGPVFPGSGAGIIYYAHPHFPAQYRNAYFINDWMYGTYVYRPVWEGSLIQPAGGRWEHFAMRGDGKVLYRPTDLEFAADGSIYVCGWGDGYHYDRGKEGSWIFRIAHAGQAVPSKSEWYPEKRTLAYSKWSVAQLVEDLGPEVLPIWRVNAQDELVRRGEAVRDPLIATLDSGKLSEGQQTWAIWALARSAPQNTKITELLDKLADPAQRSPLNLRLQAIRILAFQLRNDQNQGTLPASVIASLSDSEPRVRFEAVQAIWQARQTQHLNAVIDQLANEEDRLVFYSGWGTLRELANVPTRKKLLQDRRPAVRLAALLSLLERHEISLDEVMAVAERDSDPDVVNYALTWAMNPQPPKKMPNTTARVVLEDSVKIRALIERAREAQTPKLRRVYLKMVSRATYRGDDDWERLREFYGELKSDDERALVLVPLARENDAKSILWKALGGRDVLRQAAVKGFASLARRAGNSPEEIAGYLLEKADSSSDDRSISGAIVALARLELPESEWRPTNHWDAVLARAFHVFDDVPLRAKILTLLLAIDPATLAAGDNLKGVLKAASADPDPRLYTSLVALNDRLGIHVEMTPPEKATVDDVLTVLNNANASADRGRELFFSKNSASGCMACHRVAGRGNNFAPDLSGIAQRSEMPTIIQAIIEPSATITEGFQLQVFETTDGTNLGVVMQETDAEIRILKPDGSAESFASSTVTSRQKIDQSVMPATYAYLGNEQVADIAAFLGTLRHSAGNIVSQE